MEWLATFLYTDTNEEPEGTWTQSILLVATTMRIITGSVRSWSLGSAS